MIPLIGYGDRLSVRPGETIEFKVGSQGSAPFEASLVRIICADPNPAGPGIQEVPVAADFAGSYPSRAQDVAQGSYGRVAARGPLGSLEDQTLVATIWPTMPGRGEQGVLARFDPESGAGFALALGADGSATAILGQASGAAVRISVGKILRPRTWYRVWASFDSAKGRLAVGQAPVRPDPFVDRAGSAEVAVEAAADGDGPLLIGALGGRPVTGHFNGKIEAPAVFDRALGAVEAAAAEFGAAGAGEVVPGLVARWDFAQEISGTRIVDTGPAGAHGTLVNMPARAMTGARWDGREICWRHAPEDYAAIHFHDTDITDCGWDTDFTFTVPRELPSGVYGARLVCGSHQDTTPFVVCPPKGTRAADLCVVIPTFTYVIYGNHARVGAGGGSWGCYIH